MKIYIVEKVYDNDNNDEVIEVEAVFTEEKKAMWYCAYLEDKSVSPYKYVIDQLDTQDGEGLLERIPKDANEPKFVYRVWENGWVMYLRCTTKQVEEKVCYGISSYFVDVAVDKQSKELAKERAKEIYIKDKEKENGR